jgi:hypothetical protein
VQEWLTRISLACCGVVVAAIAFEGFARAFGLAPEFAPIEIDQPYATFESSPNPILRYVPKPGSEGISSYGIRDVEFGLEKPADTFRVIVVGDSIGWGFCNENEALSPDATFANVAERRLNERPISGYRAVEVINLSVSGYDTLQEVEFLRVKGLALEPDLVVVGYCLNDTIDSSMEFNALRKDEDWGMQRFQGELLQSAFSASHLFRAVWYRLGLLTGPGSVFFEPIGDRRAIGLERLQEFGQREPFKTLVLVFPYLDPALPYPHMEEHRDIRRAALDHGFEVLDLLPLFRRATADDISKLRGRCSAMHPDERGHRIAASAIERFIRTNTATAQGAR